MALPKNLNEALLVVQRDAPKIQKDKVNPAFGRGSKYASTDGILAELLPLLNANGLLLQQHPTTVTEMAHGTDSMHELVLAPALRTRITHVATGDFIEDTALLMLDKQNAQGLGGAITYMRRYALVSILGLVTEVDDDGNSASRQVEVVNKRPRSAAAKAAVDLKLVDEY